MNAQLFEIIETDGIVEVLKHLVLWVNSDEHTALMVRARLVALERTIKDLENVKLHIDDSIPEILRQIG